MSTSKLRIGSRDSQLALAQAHLVMDWLIEIAPCIPLELHTFKTKGDIQLDQPLSEIGDKGLFVKELEVALLEKQIDVAIHSLKDMPSLLPHGLLLVSVGEREDPRDVMISRDGFSWTDLPSGSRIGTSSLRRLAQLKRLRPDLTYLSVRGNLNTRLRKLEEGQYDALILAAAGVHRLGWHDKISHYFDPHTELIPAIGQGILGAEYRTDDEETAERVSWLTRSSVEIATQAERQVLKTLEGGCKVPLGAYAMPVSWEAYRMQAILLDVDGSHAVQGETQFSPETATAEAEQLALSLLAQGGSEIKQRILAAGIVS